MAKLKASVGTKVLFSCMGRKYEGTVVGIFRGSEPDAVWRRHMGPGVFYKCATEDFINGNKGAASVCKARDFEVIS